MVTTDLSPSDRSNRRRHGKGDPGAFRQKVVKRYAHLDQTHKRKEPALLRGWAGEDTWHISGTTTEMKENGPEGQYPQALVFTGAEGGI
jgi:hypothetical protein